MQSHHQETEDHSEKRGQGGIQSHRASAHSKADPHLGKDPTQRAAEMEVSLAISS
jgi:hypothetical protein